MLVWSSLSWEGADLRQLCLLLEAQFQRRREPGRRSCLSSHCKTDLLLGLPLAQTKKSTIKVGMADCVSVEDTKAYENRRGVLGLGGTLRTAAHRSVELSTQIPEGTSSLFFRIFQKLYLHTQPAHVSTHFSINSNEHLHFSLAPPLVCHQPLYLRFGSPVASTELLEVGNKSF